MKKLSILIPSIAQRRHRFLNPLLDNLERQCVGRDDVEIICLYDNRVASVGSKRNSLLSAANGKYFTFVDDDDRVTDDYVSEIISAIDRSDDADCITYEVICSIGPTKIHCKYGLSLEYNNNNSGVGFWTGKPAHTMIFKSSLCKNVMFPDKNYGEDFDWVQRAIKNLNTELNIPKVLYYYDFNPATSATRGK